MKFGLKETISLCALLLVGILYLTVFEPYFYDRVWCVINEMPSITGITALWVILWQNKGIHWIYTAMLCFVTGMEIMTLSDALFRVYIYLTQYNTDIFVLNEEINKTYPNLQGVCILISGIFIMTVFFKTVTSNKK